MDRETLEKGIVALEAAHQEQRDSLWALYNSLTCQRWMTMVDANAMLGNFLAAQEKQLRNFEKD